MARPVMVSTSPISRLQAIPRLWPNSTIVCVGTGPSILRDDIEHAYYAGAHLLAINDAWKLTGRKAELLFASDAKWWRWITKVPDSDLPEQLWSVDPEAVDHRPSIRLVNYRSGLGGLSTDPSVIHTGGHSGYMAVNIAAHLGAAKIILLGYDMYASDGRHHFFGDHPDGNHVNYEYKTGVYASLRAPLEALGIHIFNATRLTALTHIPRCSLKDALAA